MKASEGAAGYDLFAYGCGIRGDFVRIQPLERILIGIGIALKIPDGWEGQIRPRSGWALRDGLTVLNSPGTVDSDYTGEVKVLLINLGDKPVTVAKGDRIAQLVLCPVVQAVLRDVEVFSSETVRGEKGFGSSGK